MALRTDPLFEALSAVHPVRIGGALGNLVAMPSPPDVHTTKAIPVSTPRATLKFEPAAHAVAYHRVSYSTDLNRHHITTGVCAGGLRFPNRCAECGGAPDHAEVTEVYGPAKSGAITGAKLTFPGLSNAAATRIVSSLAADRYWYAVPFCATHNLRGRSVHFGTAGTLELTNRDIAREVAILNGFTGAWASSRRRLLLILDTVVLVIASSLVVGGFFGLFGDSDEAGAQGPGLAIAFIVVGVLMAIPAIIARVRSHDEPLDGPPEGL